MDFLYNIPVESGGRWHVVTDLKVEVKPEQRTAMHESVIDWNKGVPVDQKVEGVEYYVPEWQRESSRMVLKDGRWTTVVNPIMAYPIRGWVDGWRVRPEHIIATGVPHCGVTSRVRWDEPSSEYRPLRVNNFYSLYPKVRVKDIGKQDVLLIQGRAGQTIFMRDPATPPAPLCEHCRTKYGL